MQMTYDQAADALYIQLTSSIVNRSKQINPNFMLDLDENGDVIGIEVLNVRKTGIDPLKMEFSQTGSDEDVERPNQEIIHQGRAKRMKSLKRQRHKAAQDTP